MANLIDIEHLSKSYGKNKVLEDISVSFEGGNIIGLLGPNGSGKTSLIKIMTGLINDYEGSVKIDGHSPDPYTKSIVAYLPEKTYLADWMRPVDAVNYFADFYEDFDKAKAVSMINSFRLPMKQKIKSMSKGMQEKLQLVLVMCRKARLYLLDEPIGGVDPAARDYILNTIIRNYNEDATMILSTHLIHDIEAVFDDVVMIGGGHIVLAGSVDAIREERDKSIDTIFREVFRCWGN